MPNPDASLCCSLIFNITVCTVSYLSVYIGCLFNLVIIFLMSLPEYLGYSCILQIKDIHNCCYMHGSFWVQQFFLSMVSGEKT